MSVCLSYFCILFLHNLVYTEYSITYKDKQLMNFFSFFLSLVNQFCSLTCYKHHSTLNTRNIILSSLKSK